MTCLLVTHWSPLFFSGDCLQATAPHTMQKLFHPNRTELANQRETNGSVQTSVFSRHRVVSRRWRDDRVVASPLRGMKKKIKAANALCSLAAVVAADPESVVRAD